MLSGLHNIYIVLIIVAFLGITIFVHEFGHFIVARLCGLVVEVFSIGFGPAIWKKKHNGIIYKIGWIPFGGYVALPQLDPSGMSTIQTPVKDAGQSTDSSERKLPQVPAWKKILVSLAGGTGNVLLAIGIAWIVYLIGMPAGPAERSTVAGYVASESKAYKQGLRIGDEILSVNGVTVRKWREFRMESVFCDEVTLLVRSPEGYEKTITVTTEEGEFGEQTVAGVSSRNLCVVLSVEPGMSAEKADIKSGDTIIEFADKRILSRAHLIDLVNQHKDKSVPIKVKRPVEEKSVLLTMPVAPTFDEKIGRARIGIMFNTMAVEHDTIIRPLPSEQLRHHATAILRFFRALMTPKQAKAASRAVGGPVAIMVSYWFIVKMSIMLAVWFTGFLNVNLAIINLLPIPVLDGGHIVFSLWEAITRRPPRVQVVNILINIFLVLIIGLFVLLSIRDIERFTPAGRYIRDFFRGKTETAE